MDYEPPFETPTPEELRKIHVDNGVCSTNPELTDRMCISCREVVASDESKSREHHLAECNTSWGCAFPHHH
jgi:hypothetical protein